MTLKIIHNEEDIKIIQFEIWDFYHNDNNITILHVMSLMYFLIHAKKKTTIHLSNIYLKKSILYFCNTYQI